MSEFRRRLMMQSKAESPILKDYLTVVALEDGLTAKLSINACEYCVDGDGNWKTLPADTKTEVINVGQTLSFRGNLTPTSNNGIGTFIVNKYFNLKGNCMSMLFGDEGKESFSLSAHKYAFYYLFQRNTRLLSAKEFLLPATTLSISCYRCMFNGCTSLMFAPKLPAINLAGTCYGEMFQNCNSLTEAPELPANTLVSHCYWRMFRLCTNLSKTPVLTATTLVTNCYYYMFSGCSKVNNIKMLATDISAEGCLTNWVYGVDPNGIFVKSKDATWDVVGVNGVPEGWTVITE